MNNLERPDRKESGDKLTGVTKRFCLIFLPLLALSSAITAGFLYQEIKAQRKILLSDQRQNVELLRRVTVNDIRSIILNLIYLSAHPKLHQMLENDDPDDHRPLGKRSFFSSRFSAALAQRDLTASFLHTPFLTTAL